MGEGGGGSTGPGRQVLGPFGAMHRSQWPVPYSLRRPLSLAITLRALRQGYRHRRRHGTCFSRWRHSLFATCKKVHFATSLLKRDKHRALSFNLCQSSFLYGFLVGTVKYIVIGRVVFGRHQRSN